MAGVGQANKSTANVLKSIGGDKVPIVKDALSGIDKMSDPLIQQGGTGILSQVTQSLPRAASNMGLAFLSGGASVPAQLGSNATLQATKQVLTSPTFVNSMLQSYGGAYGQAREEGANRPQAITKAVLQAFPEALIEQAGGVEQLPTNVAKQGLLKTIGKSALEEGVEEVFQYPFEALARKATYAPDTPFFSMTENAVINPKDMAQGAIVGGLAGGLLGGGAKVATGGVSLPKLNHPIEVDTPSVRAPIEAQTAQPVFYTDPYGNVTTDLNQAPLLLPEAKQTAKPQMPTAEELAILNNPTTEIDTETNFPKLDHLSVSEVNSLITELKTIRQKILDEQVNWLKNSMQGVEQGGIVRDMWGDVVDRFGRTSNNEYWYQQWAKKNNYRKPTKAELYEIAEQQLYEGVQANDTFIPPNEEFIQTDKFIDYAESQLNSAQRKADIQNRVNEYEQFKEKEFYTVPFDYRREAPFTARMPTESVNKGGEAQQQAAPTADFTPIGGKPTQQEFTPIGGKPETPQGRIFRETTGDIPNGMKERGFSKCSYRPSYA